MATNWIREALCSLHGHDNLLQYGPDRMYLKCVSCGHESAGWSLTEKRPTVTVHGDAERHVLERPRLVVGARRAA
jgi:hypothetical protein